MAGRIPEDWRWQLEGVVPGPWRWVGGSLVVAGDGKHVLEGREYEVLHAHAQLITAAPELHDALVSLVVNLMSGHDPAGPLEHAMGLLGRLREAVKDGRRGGG